MPPSSQIQWACGYKNEKEMWNGKPSLECVNGRYPPPKTPAGVLPWTCRSDGKWPDRLVGKTTIASGLHLGRSEVLRSLRHYMRAQNQGRHTIDRLEERGVERGSARRSSSKGRDRAIVSQNEHLNLLKSNIGENCDRRDGAPMCFSEHIDTILKLT